MGEFPSRENQFGPGNNANPKGRPRGKSITTFLREIGDAVAFRGKGGAQEGSAFKSMLEQMGLVFPDDAADAGDGPQLTFNQLAALRLWAIGLHDWEQKHALKALQIVLDRQEGRAKQTVEVSGEGGGPVAVTLYLPENGRDDGRRDDPPPELAAPGDVPGQPG